MSKMRKEALRYIVNADDSLLTVIEKNNMLSGTGVIVSDNGKLVGTITDGDIRRWIIKKKSIDARADEVANKSPVFLYHHQANQAIELMKKCNITILAITNDELDIEDIVCSKESIGGDLILNDVNCPVVIMAGGKGTRLYPYTKVLPKPLIPIGDIPIAEHIMAQFHKYGCSDFYMIVNHMGNMIKAYFNEQERDYNLSFIDEQEPLGTGGGISLLDGYVNDTFILTNCDIIIQDNLFQAYKYHRERNNIITMICSLQKHQIPYGVVEVDKDGSLKEMKEKPTISYFTNTGCYIVEAEVIHGIKKNTKIDFPDLIKKYRDEGKNIGIFPISEEAWLDMGQPDQLEKMREILG